MRKSSGMPWLSAAVMLWACPVAADSLCSPPPVTLGDGPYVLRLMQDLVAARRIEAGQCKPVQGTGSYEGHTLSDCTYAISGRRRIVEKKGKLEAVAESEGETWTARALVLNASAETLAQWTLDACREADKEIKNCALDLCDYVKSHSAAEFPVKGVVVEGDKTMDPKAGTAGHLSVFYRDGVATVTGRSRELARTPAVSGRSFPGRTLSEAEIAAAMSEEYTGLREIKPSTRAAGVTADCYQLVRDRDDRAAGRTRSQAEDPVIEGGKPVMRWLEVSRDRYLDALKAPDDGYEMFRILARVLKRKGANGDTFTLACR